MVLAGRSFYLDTFDNVVHLVSLSDSSKHR